MKTMKLYLGTEVISFVQRGNGKSVIVTGDGLNKVALTVNEANSLWNGKRSLGWTSEKPTFAPNKPKWNFGEKGFQRDEYERIALENGYGYRFRRGGVDMVHVYKNHREDVYRLMGGIYA